VPGLAQVPVLRGRALALASPQLPARVSLWVTAQARASPQVRVQAPERRALAAVVQ
jgi:hypothetical protein